MKINKLQIVLFLLLIPFSSFAKSGVPFNSITDIHWGEINLTIEGICICVKGWHIEVGVVVNYWEPFLLVDTVSEANYSPMLGQSVGLVPYS